MFAIWICSALLVLILALQGCVSNQKVSPIGPLDFAWKLSGDRSVAPLQVFSDATHIWLQWQPNQVMPAIFGVVDGSEQLASYTRQGPYSKLEGHWGSLVFRSAHRQARARHPKSTSVTQTQPVNSIQSAPPAVSPVVSNVTPQSPTQVAQVLPVKSVSQPFYAITRTDKNLRQALSRWTGLSGWKFQTEHWAVDVDIPLTATATFSDNFIDSVRALIEATELSERPLQPCFYSNQVLRIVPITEACDRTIIEGARV